MVFDIVVVGGGIAGLMAAIEAKTDTNKVAVITKGNLFKSNSSLASGGINAVLNEDDLVEQRRHVDDTISGAYGLANNMAVRYMCGKASKIVHKLVEYGVEFDTNPDGSIAQRSFGGGSSKRTCYVADKTGSAITQALIKTAKIKGITFVVNNFVMNIVKYNNTVSGVVCLRRFDSSVMVYPAKAVILAGGGYAGIYRGYSTNAQDYTGDMHALALRAGLNLKDMEFVQFHPTGLTKTSYLVSEAARGEGGYLVNSLGHRFVDELATRDIVSQAIASEISEGKQVFIDLRHLSPEHIESKLPSLQKAALNQMGIDICTELLPIKPVAHYTMGGIESNMTTTSIKGLYVCGECASVGVHGANRLGGNSLLEGAVFGELAGIKALEFSKSNKSYQPMDYNVVVKDQMLVDRIFDSDTTKNFNAMRITLGKTMFENCGITRSKGQLVRLFDYLKYLRKQVSTLHCMDKSRNNNVELISILELRNALEVSEAVVFAALKREESRGAHHRSDFPDTKEELSRSILIKELNKGLFKVWYEEKGFWENLRKMLMH